MMQHLINFENKVEQLAETGVTLPGDLKSIMLLGTLPEYGNFCVAIDSRDDISTVGNLKIKLIEEGARQSESVGNLTKE